MRRKPDNSNRSRPKKNSSHWKNYMYLHIGPRRSIELGITNSTYKRSNYRGTTVYNLIIKGKTNILSIVPMDLIIRDKTSDLN